MAGLDERTRWEPAEAERAIFERWLESGLFARRAGRDGGRELLDRDPAAERHRRAAHGPRAQRLGAGHADPLQPHARPPHALDARHGPRRHRDADAGREAARARGHDPRGDRPRGVRRARLEVARGVRRDHLQAVPAARRVVRLRARALHAGRGLRARGAEGLRRPLRQGPDLPRQPDRQLGPGLALGDLRPRGRGARGHRHALPRRLPAGLRRRRRSRSPRCGRRRCWPTPRSRCTRTTSATRGWSARRRSCRSSAAGCGSSPTRTSSPSSARAR